MTDWEQRYRTGDTPWDKGAPHPALIDFLAAHPLRGKILVPGCGLGYDVRAIASGENEVVGLDIAPSAIERAKNFPRRANEIFQLGDLFALPENFRGRFDAVFEHTCFCAIDPSRRAEYVKAVAGALKPGGNLLAIFYLDPGGGSEDGPPFGVSLAELDALFSPHFVLRHDEVPARTYPGREGRERLRLLQIHKEPAPSPKS